MDKYRCYNYCPKCHSENLDAEPLQRDSDYAWSDVTCKSCGYTWEEVFDFTYNLEINKDEKGL